jgi:hypothetical protein
VALPAGLNLTHITPKEGTPNDLRCPRASPVGLPVKRGLARHPFSDSAENIAGRLALMDEVGVEKQVLSPNHPPYLPNEAECVKAIQMLNDGYADLAHR